MSDRYPGAKVAPLNWPPPPPPIPADSLMIEREVNASGQVVTRYVDRVTGLEVGVRETIHLQGVKGGFVPPPAIVAVMEAEQILADEAAASEG